MSVCRLCGASLREVFADLGMSPLANSYRKPEQLQTMEPFYPLRAYVCHQCFLVQLEQFETPESIFTEYAYFSSFSTSWLEHARCYAGLVRERFGLGSASQVVEIASNDGYLLQYFKERGVAVLGVEPARTVAEAAIQKGIPTRNAFFNKDTATKLVNEGLSADLIVANNVLAHVPDLHHFIAGFAILLKPQGLITLEFPHLLELMRHVEFDTIYHEHFSYLSLLAVERLLAAHNLAVFDVERLPTHGGSLRLYVKHAADGTKPTGETVARLRKDEAEAHLDCLETYRAFSNAVKRVKLDLLEFLIGCARTLKSVAGYGAPAKGNTLLNYCGIGPELLPYTVDRNPHKQGLYLPGTQIPVEHPDRIAERRPDFLLILPWNLKQEIAEQMACIRGWGGRFVTPIPSVDIF